MQLSFILGQLVDSDCLHLFAIWSKGTFGMTVFGTACMSCLEPYEPKQLAVIFKFQFLKIFTKLLTAESNLLWNAEQHF